jgi:hypothetical protein
MCRILANEKFSHSYFMDLKTISVENLQIFLLKTLTNVTNYSDKYHSILNLHCFFYLTYFCFLNYYRLIYLYVGKIYFASYPSYPGLYKVLCTRTLQLKYFTYSFNISISTYMNLWCLLHINIYVHFLN